MRTARITVSACILSLALCATAEATLVELKNDGFVSGQAAGFQGGFVAGEIGAVRLDPPPGGPYQVTSVTLLFGGATTSQDVTLTIWQDTGGVNPGTQIYTADYTLMGANDAFSVIDLSANSVYVTGPFRVGIVFQHSGYPSIARDNDGTINAAYNFIMAQGFGWVNSNILGLTGDWVIRATIDDGNNPVPDAGVPDAAVPDASVPDAAPDPDSPMNLPDAAPVPDAPIPGPDAGTGETCRVHSECPTGQYCNENDMCDYDCRVDFDCGNGMRCTSLGQCEPEPGSGGGCAIDAPKSDSHLPWGAWGLTLFGLFAIFRSRARARTRRRRPGTAA